MFDILRFRGGDAVPRTRLQRAGFTIIELLAVISLIAMLIALVFGAAQYVVTNARKQQANATAQALQVAIASYRHEYGQWPVDPSLSASASATHMLTVTGAMNYLVFDMLRASSGTTINPYNTNNVPFIDNSTVLVPDPNHPGQCEKRYLLPSSGGLLEAGHPIVYMAAKGGIGYYGVTIDFEAETVTIKNPY